MPVLRWLGRADVDHRPGYHEPPLLTTRSEIWRDRGVETLSVALSEDVDTLTDVYEPFYPGASSPLPPAASPRTMPTATSTCLYQPVSQRNPLRHPLLQDNLF